MKIVEPGPSWTLHRTSFSGRLPRFGEASIERPVDVFFDSAAEELKYGLCGFAAYRNMQVEDSTQKLREKGAGLHASSY